MRWINWLYVLFLGIILAITTGFGLAAFYPQPHFPSSWTEPSQVVSKYCYETPQNQTSPECQKSFALERQNMQKNEKAQQDFMNKNAGYTRTAVFFGIVIGALFVILGISLLGKSKLVVNGLLLGGVLTAILTRLLISLASLGSSTTGTNGPDTIAYVEFAILLILTGAIISLGFFKLKEVK